MSVHNSGSSSFLSGYVDDTIDRVEVRPDGARRVRVVEGFLLTAVPPDGPLEVVGFDREGSVVDRVDLRPR